jgi:hypothetical protein
MVWSTKKILRALMIHSLLSNQEGSNVGEPLCACLPVGRGSRNQAAAEDRPYEFVSDFDIRI